MDPQFRGYYDPAQTEYYYQQEQESYIRPDISFESTHDLYTQAQLQRAQEINLQQHYQLQDIDRSLAALSNQESPEEKWPMANKHIFTSREQLTPSHDKSELRVSYPVEISPFHLKFTTEIYTEIPFIILNTEWTVFFTDLGNVRRGFTESYSRRTCFAVDTVATSEQQYSTLNRAVLHKHSR